MHLKCPAHTPTPPGFVGGKGCISVSCRSNVGKRGGQLEAIVKGPCPRLATWRDDGPTAGSTEFQQPGTEGTMESSKTETSPPRSKEPHHKSTTWRIASYKLPSGSENTNNAR